MRKLMQPLIRNTRLALLNAQYGLLSVFGIIASIGRRSYTREKNNALLGSIFFEVEFST